MGTGWVTDGVPGVYIRRSEIGSEIGLCNTAYTVSYGLCLRVTSNLIVGDNVEMRYHTNMETETILALLPIHPL